MKKLLLLCLVLMGMVNTASAWNYLAGSFNGWSTASPAYCLDNGPVAVYLTADTYEFKVIEGSTWCGASIANITGTTTDIEIINNGGNNISMTVETAGYYVFSSTWDSGKMKLTVRYPDTTVYFYNSLEWSNVYLHDGWWRDNDNKGATNQNALRGIAMTAGENNIYSAYIPKESFYRITFTSDKQVNDGDGQYGAGYENFYGTNVVWKEDEFDLSKPLYVPTTTVSATINSCSYYYGGEWHPFPTYTRTVTDGNFGTICLPFNATVVGAKIFNISGVVMGSNNKVKYINLEEVEGNVMEAGKAYIFQATSSTLTATLSGNYSDAIAIADAGNGMKGNISSTKEKVTPGYYIVKDNQIREAAGDYVVCGQYKGYITLVGITPTSARGAYYMSFEDETTGIANVDINDNFDANAPMYNLAGQRVNKSYKGVVVVNGKKMLNK